MLTKLRINNYALIDSIEISFEQGMTSITGETGAGKSIILGGLSMVLGSRVDNSKIINKNKKCFVEASFDLSNQDLSDFFSKNDLDYEPVTLLRREVNQSGRSRAFINDTPVKIDQLSSLTNKLIDVHSQFNNLDLLDSNFIFIILDSLSNNVDNYKNYLNDFNSLKTIRKLLEEKKDERDSLNSDLDYNKYLLNEFNEISFDTINLEDITNKLKEADNIDQLKESLSLITSNLHADDVGIIDKLTQMTRGINKLSDSSDRINKLNNLLNVTCENLQQIASDAESILMDVSNQDVNIIGLRDIQDRLYSLQNKHRVESFSDLLEIKNSIVSKIANYDNIDDEIEELESSSNSFIKNLNVTARIIHDNRLSVVSKFETMMNQNLIELGMEKSDIKISLAETDEIQKNGISNGDILLKSNKADEYNYLKDIASGGEISRIMLSIKSILSKFTRLNTIIFDEIDTGISGSVSSKVADLMKGMSRNMQLIVITHTPQVASKGDFQFKVYKREDNEKVITDIKILSDKERVKEIAEMLSGDKSNKSANELANELLN